VKTPFWDNPPADVILVSALVDDLSFEHMQDRMKRALAACVDLRHVTTQDCYGKSIRVTGEGIQDPSDRHHVFEGRNGVSVTVKPFGDSTTVVVATSGLSLNLKIPPDRSAADMADPLVPAAIIRAAQRSMCAYRIRSRFSLSPANDGEQLIAGMTPHDRNATDKALRTCCALIASGNPDRLASSRVRIQFANPTRDARIVDGRGGSLFRRPVEKLLTQGLPRVFGIGSTMYGYVDLEGTEVSMTQGSAELDTMSTMRLLAEGGIDPTDALLAAARNP
jgi:hypothetical protein